MDRRFQGHMEQRGGKYRGKLIVAGDKEYLPKDRARSFRVFYTRWYHNPLEAKARLNEIRWSFPG